MAGRPLSAALTVALGAGWVVAVALWLDRRRRIDTATQPPAGPNDRTDTVDPTTAKVFLVGAGPGGVGLITVRGHRLLASADVVVADELADPALLLHARSDATLIIVGKRGGKSDSVAQPEINQTLVDHAAPGRLVVRLKGGDPLVFGRALPEIEALTAAGIAYEVVPGVTSALAACAAVGIPVTDKVASKAFVVLSGHQPDAVDWDAIARIDTALVLMGTRKLDAICTQLQQHGKPPSTPLCVVQWAFSPKQRVLVGQLGHAAAALRGTPALSPAIIIVGEVAAAACAHPDAEHFELTNP